MPWSYKNANAQLSVVIVWPNIVRYYINIYNNWGRTPIRCWIRKKTPHTSPVRVRYGVSLFRYLWENWPHYNGTALYFTFHESQHFMVWWKSMKNWKAHIPRIWGFYLASKKEKTWHFWRRMSSRILRSSHCAANFNCLTHWGQDNMAAIFQRAFPNEFSWKKMFEFWLKSNWKLFLMVQLIIFQHWFR